MSISSIRTALETKLNSITPAISLAWENVPFTPVTGVPYAQMFLIPAAPDNSTLGDGFYREQGLLQVSLFYPLQAGPQTAEARASLIRAAFKRGTGIIIGVLGISWDGGISWDNSISWAEGTITIIIDRTPEIGQGRVDGDRWHVPVKIRYEAGIIA